MNKKSKNIPPRIQFLMHVQSTIESSTKHKSVDPFKNLGKKFRNMILLNVNEIDEKIRRKCIRLSFDLEEMNSAERLAFMYEDPSFPKYEKMLMINTCITVMEQIEAYEVCATLDRMRKYMNRECSYC
jgi:hypothetical protein